MALIEVAGVEARERIKTNLDINEFLRDR